MTFLEALERILLSDKMIRRKKWPDGVVASLDRVSGRLTYYHVAATDLPTPPATHYLEEDWIVVEDYGKDISYNPFG